MLRILKAIFEASKQILFVQIIAMNENPLRMLQEE